ncbi:MAG: TldD/PmbA family protein [Candidatus Thorarchaeota archaeon]
MKDQQSTLLNLAEKTVAYGSNKVDQIEVLVQDNYEIGVEINLGQINKAIKLQEVGASIRCVIKQRIGSAFTNRLDFMTLKKTVNRAISAAKASTPDKTWRDFPGKVSYSPLSDVWDDSIPDKDPSVYVDLTATIGKRITERDSSIIIGEAGSGGFYGWNAYANTNGVATSDRGTGVYAYADIVARTDTGMTPSITTIDVNRHFHLDLDYVVDEAVMYVLLAKTHAKGRTEAGTVIFSPRGIGGILGHAFLPALMGENVVRKKSKLADKMDELIASKLLSVTDSGRIPGGYSTSLFDGEGSPRQTTSLIEKGKLRSFLWNNYWAQRHGVSSTGNAIRNLRTGVVDTATSNMIIEGGNRSFEDMIGDIKSGYLIKGLQGAHSSNKETGDYSVVANPAFRIENGELQGVVHGLMLAGNAFEFLKKIEVVGNDVLPHLVGPIGSFIAPSIQFSDIQVVAKAE